MENNELIHWGVLGMKWGVRRYQNKDGTLTNAGKKRYNKEMESMKAEQKVLNNKKRTQAKIDKLSAMRKSLDDQEASLKNATKKPNGKSSAKGTEQEPKKSIKDLSDEELAQKINRLRLEQTYEGLVKPPAKEKAEKGKSFASQLKDDAIKPALISSGKQLLEKFVINKGMKMLGLNEKQLKSARDALKDEVEGLELNKRKAEAQDFLNKRAKEAASKESSSANDSGSSRKKYTVKSKKSGSESTSSKTDSESFVSSVLGEGSSKRSSNTKRNVYDVDFTEVSSSPTTSRGSKYVSGLLGSDNASKSSNSTALITTSNVTRGETYIAGLLPAPKDDD